MPKQKWFHPKRETGWREDSSTRARRRTVYEHTKSGAEGRYARLLLAERQMFALAHVNEGPKGDPGTRMKAEADGEYFKRQREKMKRKAKRKYRYE